MKDNKCPQCNSSDIINARAKDVKLCRKCGAEMRIIAGEYRIIRRKDD